MITVSEAMISPEFQNNRISGLMISYKIYPLFRLCYLQRKTEDLFYEMILKNRFVYESFVKKSKKDVKG